MAVLHGMGRYVFGAASVLLGVASLALRDQLTSNWQLPGETAFIFVTSVAQMVGGVAVQFWKTERLGAITLGIVYLLFALTLVPEILAQPGIYASWGNVFYGLALVAGALLAYGLASPASYAKTVYKAPVTLFGLCAVSFAVEQVEFFGRTISLVPKWIPLSGMFWGVATTIAFGLAGVSILSGYKSLLASRLLTLMLVIFGVAIWIPALIADPRTHSNWGEGLETFAIAGAAWIVADFLGREGLVQRST
ncbi:MAG: hypothetical protein ACREM8_01560 [Vulcanimicrobiaceae bacterium]